MQIDAIVQVDLANAAEIAQRAERLGFDRMMVAEVAHDPFLPLALAIASTTRLSVGTGIAVAFARSPMTVAVTGADLHRQSNGRFALGLGSQIKAHVTRRFSMDWSNPAPRMREYIGALRAIWASWQTGAPLQFEGEFYRHTLMTPMFSHGPSQYGDPQIFLAGVGPLMTALAGEVADGFLAHGFVTPEYLRDVTLPKLAGGLGRAQRDRSAFEVSAPLFIALGHDEDDLAGQLALVRHTLAFYGSTPAYRPVLEHHGWGELGVELTRLSKQGDWAAMGRLIDDDVLDAFAIVATPEAFPAEFVRRYGTMLDRVQIGLPEHLSDDVVGALVEDLRVITSNGTPGPGR